MKIEKAPDLSGCVTVTTTDREPFLWINLGKVDAMKAFNSGKFKVEGDFGALAKTGKMFRKYIPPKKELTPREYILDMFGRTPGTTDDNDGIYIHGQRSGRSGT